MTMRRFSTKALLTEADLRTAMAHGATIGIEDKPERRFTIHLAPGSCRGVTVVFFRTKVIENGGRNGGYWQLGSARDAGRWADRAHLCRLCSAAGVDVRPVEWSEIPGVLVFTDDGPGAAKWIRDHRRGWVARVGRRGTTVHRAHCRALTLEFVRAALALGCSGSPLLVVDWAREVSGGADASCECLDDAAKARPLAAHGGPRGQHGRMWQYKPPGSRVRLFG